MTKVHEAVNLFAQGYACSQAILATYGPALGLERAMAVKIAEGFVGGFAFRGRTCGAVTAAAMVLGLRYGRTAADDHQAAVETRARIDRFTAEFAAQNGSLRCRDLLGCEIDTDSKLEAAVEAGLFDTVCTKAVRSAAEILESLLESA